MSSPKFQVGDEVIFLSVKVSPGEWLDSVIEEVRFSATGFKHKSGGISPPGYLYYLRGYSCAIEKNIRKKHKPSDQSFDQIIQSIKNGVPV